jgi:hypothetical protein
MVFQQSPAEFLVLSYIWNNMTANHVTFNMKSKRHFRADESDVEPAQQEQRKENS